MRFGLDPALDLAKALMKALMSINFNFPIPNKETVPMPTGPLQTLIKSVFIALIALAHVGVIAETVSESSDPQNALIILTSDSLQTRGMAMVLGNQIQAQGGALHLLLCDSAGDLALKGYESAALKPRGMRPEALMQQLIEKGAKVEVCALYLPNKEVTQGALRAQIGVAQPPAIGQKIMDPSVRVFGF